MSHFSDIAAGTLFSRILSRVQERLGTAVLALAIMLAGAQSVLAHEFKVGDIEIGHPWSRATPAGAKVAGGYFTITNNGSAPDRLLSISSDISDKAELHEMGVKDGVMTMRPVVGGLEIPAGGKVVWPRQLSRDVHGFEAATQARRDVRRHADLRKGRDGDDQIRRAGHGQRGASRRQRLNRPSYRSRF